MKTTPKTIRVAQPATVAAEKNTLGVVGVRIYGTRDVVAYPFGDVMPAPGSWFLVDDKRAKIARGRFHFPEFDLEPTAKSPGRVRFYAFVCYHEDGSEREKRGNVFELPRSLAPAIDFGDLFGLAMRLSANQEGGGVV